MFVVFGKIDLTVKIYRIVEYASREQAQNAVATLSNQTLMGRLVYVREVGTVSLSLPSTFLRLVS